MERINHFQSVKHIHNCYLSYVSTFMMRHTIHGHIIYTPELQHDTGRYVMCNRMFENFSLFIVNAF